MPIMFVGFLGCLILFSCYLKIPFLMMTGFSVCWMLLVLILEFGFSSKLSLVFTDVMLVGVVLFIVSEIFVFISFLTSVIYSVDFLVTGSVSSFSMVDYLGDALVSSCLLISSGVSLTIFHALYHVKGVFSWGMIIATVVLGLIFCVVLNEEWFNFSSDWESGVFSLFYLVTGAHGAHVVLGLGLLIAVSMWGLCSGFSLSGLGVIEAAVWYWHFVDVVWLGVYLVCYW
uniref:Cytochrome c oxidase subunit 3 n=1 Tax=Paratenuisentis ambiguus TaxID=185730 RepID=K0JA11_PARAB|nr:cytochrome c oxidase subunit III [Paratenuisentis ambiguus]CCA94488.2 cytochrome oxidase subunit 3 [Paratenuisentis ambiguus]